MVESEKIVDNQVSSALNQMWNLEFTENNAEEVSFSQEDRLFLKIMTEQKIVVDSHHQLPLPFKSATPHLPESRPQALSRLNNALKRRFHCNEDFRRDYCIFMDNVVDKGYAK